MPSHWSLVIFTLMVQSAVGSVWCVQAALFWNGGLAELLQLKYSFFNLQFIAPPLLFRNACIHWPVF